LRHSEIDTPRAPISLLGRPLLDKGKPAVRRGRKATGQAESLTAGLPKEGWQSPRGNTVVFLKGDHEHSRRRLSSVASLAQSRVRWTPPGRRPGWSRNPGCVLDRSHHEFRRKLLNRSGVLSRLLQHG